MIFKRLTLYLCLGVAAAAPRTEAALAPAAPLESYLLAALWQSPTPPQTPHPAVVRVIAVDLNSMSLGSGTLVDANDQYGLVVTNWHVVRDAVGPIEVVFPDGFHSLGRVIRTDREWDLAALLIAKPLAQPVPVSAVAPRPGDPLTIAGYGSGQYKAQSGRCTAYLAPGVNRPNELVELSAAARHGDSGGPIFNSRGELAGVLFGEGGGFTTGSYGGRVHQFLQLAATDLRKLPATNTAGTNQAIVASKDAKPSSAEAAWSAVPPPAFAPPPSTLHVADRRSAAGSSAQVKEPALSMPAPSSTTANREAVTSTSGSWSWANELKSFLAAVGVAAIILQLLHRAGGR